VKLQSFSELFRASHSASMLDSQCCNSIPRDTATRFPGMLLQARPSGIGFALQGFSVLHGIGKMHWMHWMHECKKNETFILRNFSM